MNDIQEFCNATARALVNNMAMASGPMMEVNYERLSPLEDEMEIYPWKVWQTRGAEVGMGDTVKFFQPESNASELMLVYDKFEIKADDATSIPRYSHGNEKVGGAGTTASGLSMLMNSAAKGIKAAIQNFDFGITRPAIEMMYYYNMMTSSDMSIKGDSKVVARGANALLLKDMAQARRNEFLGLTNNPVDLGIIGEEGRATILRAVADDFDMPGIVPSKEVIRMKLKEQQENPQPSPEELKLQGEAEIERIKQEGEMARFDIEIKFKERQQDLELEKMSRDRDYKLAQLDAKKEADIDKQRRDEAMKIRLMEEETRRLREKLSMTCEADVEKHSLSLESKQDEAQYGITASTAVTAAEPTAATAPAAVAPQPINLTLMIDNKSGAIKKTVTIGRDSDKLMDSMEIDEVEKNG
jgi:hypothetical protein